MLIDYSLGTELIKIPKVITEAVPKNGFAGVKNNEKHSRKDLELTSNDGKHKFNIFIRKNEILIENFSVGLMYKSNSRDQESIPLIRYNGAHGKTIQDFSIDKHHSSFHIHRLKESECKLGNFELNDIEITNKFSTLEGALEYFLQEINVKNINEYFPEFRNPNFLDILHGNGNDR